MSENTKIEWCDHTFNPWEGCTKVSPGCKNCYAENRDKRFTGGIHWGKGAPRRLTSDANWKQPLRWNKRAVCLNCGYHELLGSDDCRKCGHAFGEAHRRRPRVFCASLADWLDDEVPIEWLDRLLALIHATPNLTWQLLTKRPQNSSARLHEALRDNGESLAFEEWLSRWLDGDAPAHVWIGTSVEDQARADERKPQLLDIPAIVHFLSMEPLLGAVNFGIGTDGRTGLDGIDWCIVGGESGHGARPMHPEWARGLRDQCAAAGVPFLFKQWGEYADEATQGSLLKGHECMPEATAWLRRDGSKAEYDPDLYDANKIAPVYRVGKHAAGRLLDGVEHNGFPL